MSIYRPGLPVSRTLLQRVLLGLCAIGTVLGIVAVVIVYRMMTAFNAELTQRAEAARDQVLLDAIADNSRTMILMLAAIVLVAALNIGAGIITLMRQPQRK